MSAQMSPEGPVQRQLEAYNAHDLERFIAEYAEDIEVFRPPAEPVFKGKAAFAAHYAKNRFNLKNLHATVVNRMVAGSTVVDHELVVGLQDTPIEAVVVYEVKDAKIQRVWFF